MIHRLNSRKFSSHWQLLLLWAGLILPFSQIHAGEHWSLQRITQPPVPEGINPVDHFIRQRLLKAGLEPNPPADDFTLLRRATIDLTGLPPTPAEINAFGNDHSAEAWTALIDRLLDSPHYGERWGRHWLDVARYVQGTIKVPGIDEIDLAAPYRDYVVRSFNEDKPFDRFIDEQLAGDLLETPGESTRAYFDRITAPAFLSIGQWFEECTDPNKLHLDIVDEQISTTTRAFLAMDFSCARCHDHKYDPIPTRDYYAMAGIFRSTEITSQFAKEWKDGRPRSVIPLADEGELTRLKRAQDKVKELIRARNELLKQFHDEKFPEAATKTQPDPIEDEVLAFEAEDFDGHKNLKTTRVGENTFIETRKAIDRWVKYRVIIPAPGDYTLLVRYASTSASPVVLELDLKDEPDRILSTPTYGTTQEHFTWQPVALTDLEKGSLHIRLKVNPNEGFPLIDSFRLVRGSLAPSDPSWLRQLGPPTLSDTLPFLNDEQKREIRAFDENIEVTRQSLDFPEVTLGVKDADRMIPLPVHPGGDVYQTEGDPVPRGVPSLADHLIENTAFTVDDDMSGRIELAKWLTHPDHPLTARVMINRIWHWHFGTGIVRTTDDFGKQSSAPSHPELLDWLSAEFIKSGWSIKEMHRLIMSSETYRRSSLKTEENEKLDPDGRLLSRFPVRRLEVEAIYDGMISSIGKAPRQPATAPLDTNKSKDRALYILTSSRSPMGLGQEIRKMFPLFGFDESGRPMHDRDESLSAAQALWWLNNPLPRYYAEKLADSIITGNKPGPERAAAAYQSVMGKPINPSIETALLRYVDDLQFHEKASLKEAWTRACLGLYSSHPFSHLE
ncbi:MAG: DUF1549 domain-containing protein [Verrucomicrobiales bacterium]|nr:DUF1549 domain-containing protein [Verrucomicrobiales bacterium]